MDVINISSISSGGSLAGLEMRKDTNMLREIRTMNGNRVIIGTLNINSVPAKYENLKRGNADSGSLFCGGRHIKGKRCDVGIF